MPNFTSKWIKFHTAPADESLNLSIIEEKIFRGFANPTGAGAQAIAITTNGLTRSQIAALPEGSQLEGIIWNGSVAAVAAPQLQFWVRLAPNSILTVSKNQAAAVEILIYLQ